MNQPSCPEPKGCGSCSEACASRPGLPRIKHKIAVLSGKGGVGKSTIAVNLACSLASSGRKTGLLDVDLHGPSVPKMLGLQGAKIEIEAEKMLPVEFGGLKVMSIGLLTPKTDDPLIWRGPIKANVIRQFLEEVEWGELDYLIVDCPPGTGDEPLSVIQSLGEGVAAVVVTTPQEVALLDVRKSVNFCRALNVKILGVVENMSGFVCPHCGQLTEIFKTGGGRRLAGEMQIPFLGGIPLDPRAVEAGDEGKPYIRAFPDSPASRAVMEIISKLYADLHPWAKERVK